VYRQTSLLTFIHRLPASPQAQSGFFVLAGGLVPCSGADSSENAKATLANFIDIGEKAEANDDQCFRGVDTKKYIIETTGTGIAIFDYDNDGWPDIFIREWHKR